MNRMQGLRLGWFPKGGGPTKLAKTENPSSGGTDVRFDTCFVDFFEGLAGVADQRQEPAFHFDGRQGREVDLPKLQGGIHKGDAVRIDALL